MNFKAPRGTHDILPDQQPYWRYVEGLIHPICGRYGYRQISTPSIEETALFVRAVREGTDIVDKEMYSFEDQGGNPLTLRAEGTAPVVRAYIEHGFHMLPQPVRLYYLSSIFRQERPQAGRYREHHQFGVEAIGSMDPSVDAEILTLSRDFYERVGITGVSLRLNSIGCPLCRPGYLGELVTYYRERIAQACPDCRKRLERNPLRVLDCKVEDCQPLIEDAPHSVDHLCEACRDHFAQLREYLDVLDFPYELSHRLVRGLDYYTKTVFEFYAEGIGAQNAIGGGGRYDGLAEALGGLSTPGIGIGIGLERVILTLMEQETEVSPIESPAVFVAMLGDDAKKVGIQLRARLRQADLPTTYAPGARSLKAQMRQANAGGAKVVLILGEEEIREGVVTCRDMGTGTQETVGTDDLVDYLQRTLRIC